MNALRKKADERAMRGQSMTLPVFRTMVEGFVKKNAEDSGEALAALPKRRTL